MTPNFFNHLLLISQFECKRFFATRKGVLFLATFSVIWYFILMYPLRFTAKLLAEEKGVVTGFSFFDFIGLHSLQNWVVPEFAVLWHFALILFPLLSISFAADQTSSDRERGTLRFITLRASRDSLFFGRFTGVMLIQLLLIGIAIVSTLLLVIYRDAGLFTLALTDLSVVLINLILAILPFTAMMAILSALVKSARQATVWAIFIWSFLAGIISGLSHFLPAFAFLNYLIPGYQLAQLAQLSGWQTLQLAATPLVQSFILLAIGRWIIIRQTL